MPTTTTGRHSAEAPTSTAATGIDRSSNAMAATPASTPPAPYAALRYPTPAAPACSRLIAVTTTSTLASPPVTERLASSSTSRRSWRCPLIVCTPAAISRPRPSVARCLVGRASCGSAAIIRRLTRYASAQAATTAWVLVAASSTPPAPAPTRKPALSSELTTALALDASLGTLESAGISAARAGWFAVETMLYKTAKANTTAAGACAHIAAAHPASMAVRAALVTNRTCRREWRSPSQARTGAATMEGSACRSSATPTSVVPPIRYAYTARATPKPHLPTDVAPVDTTSRRSPRFAMTARTDWRTVVAERAARGALESLGRGGACAPAGEPSPPDPFRADDRFCDLGSGEEGNAEESQHMEGLVHHHEQAIPGRRWRVLDDADVAD